MEHFRLEKQIPFMGEYDVAVAGGGPAGICAAVAAAREGARVVLVERYGVLGGNLTAGHVGPILGMVGKGTMRDELMGLLGVPQNDMLGYVGLVHDVELAKRVLTDFVAAERIDVLLQTVVVDVITQEGSVQGLVASGKEGLYSIGAAVLVDATGDGDVAFFAGAGYEVGRRADGLTQPVTIEFTIGGIDEEKGIACIGDVDDVRLGSERFLDFTKRCAEEGLLPADLAAVRLHRTTVPGERRVNTSQVGGINALAATQLFAAEVELRGQIGTLIDFFRKHLPGYEHCRLINSAYTVGVRESRRIMGDYLLTSCDLTAGRTFEDVMVHKAEFPLDIHNPTGPGQAEDEIQHVKPYDIPYRCFLPLAVDNLLLAGRCISGTHRAHASYRIMSVCMAMGQAAGVAAALCAGRRCTPRELPPGDIQRALAARGVELFD